MRSFRSALLATAVAAAACSHTPNPNDHQGTPDLGAGGSGGQGGADAAMPLGGDMAHGATPGDMAQGTDMALANPDAIRGSGQCVEVAGGKSDNGTAIELAPCTTAAEQHWLLDADGTIRALGKCIDVPASSTTPGTAVQLYDCNGTVAQEWRLLATGQIVNPHANLCLDVGGNGGGNGNKLQLATCAGGAGQTWSAATWPVTSARVVVYYQTQYANNGATYVSPLPLLTNKTRVSDVLVAAFHLQSDLTVHLNNDPPSDPKFTKMWSELAQMQKQGVRVLGMIGGAAAGSFAGLDKDFAHYYPLLKGVIDDNHLDGVDLDVEEPMSLAGIEKVIAQLRSDYGARFVITLAPVAANLFAAGNIKGVFDHEQLYRDVGSQISWFNVQLYNGWGSFANKNDYDAMVGRNVVPAQKLVAGMLSNPGNGNGFVDVATMTATAKTLFGEHPELGGAASWEYFNSLPGNTTAPWQWASTLAQAMGR